MYEKHGTPMGLFQNKMQGHENGQMIFVGSLNCLRHKPYMQIGQLMKEGKASLLCPSMSDFSSGRYITQLEEAILELSEEGNCKDFVVIGGCQWVILSTDGDLIREHMADQGITVTINEDDHLKFGDHE